MDDDEIDAPTAAAVTWYLRLIPALDTFGLRHRYAVELLRINDALVDMQCGRLDCAESDARRLEACWLAFHLGWFAGRAAE